MLPIQVVGEGRCPIVDTWWQTETGMHMITPLPGAWDCIPGSATLPFFGVLPALLDDKASAQCNHPIIAHAWLLLCTAGMTNSDKKARHAVTRLMAIGYL